MTNRYVCTPSVVPGYVLAFALSYATSGSVFFAILHMLMGWYYVLYWSFSYTNLTEYIRSWMV